MVRGIARVVGGVAATSSVVLACEQEPLQALPSALLVVDTDVDVPKTVSRVRIDVYSEAGAWLHSRDYPVPRREDWPMSFGVAAPGERPVKAFVRLRAYTEGATRDYAGERFRPRQAFAPPKDPGQLRDVCNAARDLPPSKLGTMRQGDYNVTEDTCDVALLGGSTAFHVVVPRRGWYRFAVIESDPPTKHSLFLRRDCETQESEIACARRAEEELPRLDLDLEPGEYTLMTGNSLRYERALVTVMWAAIADWVEPRVPLVEASRPVESSSGAPRLVTAAGDETPLTEPEPGATIDRLVRLDLKPGQPFEARVTLEGACLSRMARLSVRPDGTVDAEASQACVGSRDVPAPFAEPAADAQTAPSRIGSYPSTADCSPESSDEQVVCVEGGSFVMGSVATDQSLYLQSDARSLPFRGAAVGRFFMDRYEVTVNRYRQALAIGFDAEAGTSLSPAENEGPLDFDPDADVKFSATFSKQPRGRETYPLNRVSWDRAREVCLFFGGDLPSEAQWEYAALVAGRARKATYPWASDDRPTCTTSVVARSRKDDECGTFGLGLQPVDSEVMGHDRTPLGIVGMGGNVNEYVRDAYSNYDGPCWVGAGAIDPVCIDDTAPFRMVRGGTAFLFAESARGAGRRRHTTNNGYHYDGFRCVYREPPRRRWTGR